MLDFTAALKDAVRARMADGFSSSQTRSEKQLAWADSRLASGELAGEIARLKEQPGKDILAHGGARFAQCLARLGLIDEFRLLIHPVALGSGLSLFSVLSKPIDLKLLSTTAFSSGAIAHVYRPA